MCQGYFNTYERCQHYWPTITVRCDIPNCEAVNSFSPTSNRPPQPGQCPRCSQQMTSHMKGQMPRQMSGQVNGPLNGQTKGGGQMSGPMNGKLTAQLNGKMNGQINGNGGTRHRNHSRPPSNPASIEDKDHQLAEQERELFRLRASNEKLEKLLFEHQTQEPRNFMPSKLELRGNEKFIVAGILAPFDEGARKLEEGVYRVNEGCRRLVTTPPEKMKAKELEAWRKEREGHELAWDREIRKEVQGRIEGMKIEVRENLEAFLASLK